MCGIAGVISEEQDPALGAIAEAMRDALAHRGPDGAGLFVCESGRAALGHRRLAIIDLQGGAQPMVERNHALVFNGEIYDFLEHRQRLSARHAFTTRSDTEVLLAGLALDGPASLSRLRGMFACALWDKPARTLLLARDRFGKKPLFWTRQGKRLYFASELKALLTVIPAPHVDEVALVQYLALGYVPGDRTIYRGIERLSPGSTLRWSGGEVSTARYWQVPLPDDRGPCGSREVADWEARIAPLLEEAVRVRLISDVPLGAFLSGGLDSSTVVAIAVKHAARPFHTFSVRAEGGDHADADAAFEVSRLLGTTHHELVYGCPTAADAAAMLGQVDEPFGDNSIFPTTAVSGLAREHVTVALSGDGGDELFGGYGVYRLLSIVERLSALPLARPGAALLARVWPEGVRGRGFAQRLGSREGQRYLQLIAHFWGDALERLTGAGLAPARGAAAQGLEELLRIPSSAAGCGPVARAQWLDSSRSYLPGDILPKVDIASMSRSLEVRAPLLDHRLAEALTTLPAGLRMRGSRGKLLLRRIAQGLLPEAIVERKKQGFSVPIDAWLRGGLRPLVEEHLASPGAAVAGLLDPVELMRWARPPATAEEARLQFTLLGLGVWAGTTRAESALRRS
jgi:asparagine synthase (glutamine-hydrolysing)